MKGILIDALRHLSWLRVSGVLSLAAPILMWSNFLAFAPLRHGYNLLTQPFSQLAAVGTPNAALFDLGFFLIPGALTIGIGVSLLLTLRGSRAWRAGTLLIVASGVFLFATGIFPMDYHSPAESSLHSALSQICFALASFTPLGLFLVSRSHDHLSPPRRAWLCTGLASFAIEILGFTLLPALHVPYGYFQRSLTLTLTFFFVTTGLWLLRTRFSHPLVPQLS
jgi:hypothetical membrane protein